MGTAQMKAGVVVVLALCVLVTVESFATPGDAPKVGSGFGKRARAKMRPPSKISEEEDPNGKKKSPFGKQRPIPDEKEMEEKFLARFDKMVQDSTLPPDQLMGVKEELRSHAKKRLEISKKRRILMEELEPGSKDLEDALAEVDRNLKELGLEHRKIFEAAGIKPAGRGSSDKKGPSRRPPEGREVAMASPKA